MGADTGNHRVVCKTYRYKVATDGGGTGAHTLSGGGSIPDNANIMRAWLEPITTGASTGSATIKLGFTGNDDALLAATAMDHASFVPEEPVALTAELPLKTSAAVDVIATIAVAALTAGEFDVHVEYLPGR